MKKAKFSTFLISCASACLLAVLLATLPTPAPAQTSVHLTMGNPSNAGSSSLSNYLLVKSQYATSHHCSRGIPNWVSWQLNSSWLGSAPRQDNFRADTTLPNGCYQVSSSDYTGSGFDRGHMTPSADRTNTIANNSATFLMTNIVPQAPDNNQGPWANLENYSRDLVIYEGKELYIISGGYGSGGTGSNGGASTISSGRVTVPDRVWKAILVLNQPGLGISGVTVNTRVIAVDMPNDQGIRYNDWRSYRVSVDTIEARTGYNLFSNVSDIIENTIEARVDNQ
ncbi:MAG: DNA/RNA non-specific endonuclease [Pelatocladus maniniholoensis HA4357-MV3]|jgi:endonuclease G|uniref:Endonuclease n=1 Tax=Pelatocladus maniniholoensis HA4357-MV3 TaxID=1117104 RepID=A0A9E3LUV9_9NOST|nr:DNA/RNA non-specific endonuclease [Pelatocladus maniniholoensis HA4357-MV3]BAZ65764.1 sugar-non-specific nuclease NucA homolog [Fischerella sp. NIES-4106]